MSSLITRTSDSAESIPVAVHGYQTRYESRDVVHDLIGGDIAVTQVLPRPRSGTLQLVFDTEADAQACVDLHVSVLDTFTYENSDRPSFDMTYVRLGVELELDASTATAWVVALDYQEVAP